MKKSKKRLIGFGAVVCLLVIAVIAYLSGYYHAEEKFQKYLQSSENVTVVDHGEGIISFEPDQYKAGFIFYPGGKVQYEAYAPILYSLAKDYDVLCVLLKMPGNLAVLNSDAADGKQDMWPEVEEWYIGGHSLGGAMSASYISKHVDEYKGLVLLGAYTTEDLSQTNLKLLSVYGSNDGIMQRDKYEENRSNWPKNHKEVIISGGNHAWFGAYGEQKGDGAATITQEMQWEETARWIAEMIETQMNKK